MDSQFPFDCPKRHPLATGFLNRLPSLVKGGEILGHGVLMFSDSVLPNWSAKMSDYGDIDVDSEGAAGLYRQDGGIYDV